MSTHKFKVGDVLWFRISKSRYPVQRGVVSRKIRGIDDFGRPQVKFAGWSDYVILSDEIIRVEPAGLREGLLTLPLSAIKRIGEAFMEFGLSPSGDTEGCFVNIDTNLKLATIHGPGFQVIDIHY